MWLAVPWTVTLTPAACQVLGGATVVSTAVVPGSAGAPPQLSADRAEKEPQEVAACAGAARQSAASRHGSVKNVRIRGFTPWFIGSARQTCNRGLFATAILRPHGRDGGGAGRRSQPSHGRAEGA